MLSTKWVIHNLIYAYFFDWTMHAIPMVDHRGRRHSREFTGRVQQGEQRTYSISRFCRTREG